MSGLPPFELLRPHDLDEALRAISADHVPFAGGTELLLAMKAGLFRPRALVDLKRLAQLTAVASTHDRLSIGGAATHRSVRLSEEASSLPILGDVLRNVGNPRVRAAGTLGGNLCFAEPKSDVTTLLVAMEATVELRTVDSVRQVPVSDFIVGPYTTVRHENELLTSIDIPLVERQIVYEKFQTMERPTVGVAVAEEADGSRRVVVGAVGIRPEVFPIGPGGAIDSMEIASQMEVIPDLTGGERYKRHVTSRTIEAALRNLGARS